MRAGAPDVRLLRRENQTCQTGLVLGNGGCRGQARGTVRINAERRDPGDLGVGVHPSASMIADNSACCGQVCGKWSMLGHEEHGQRVCPKPGASVVVADAQCFLRRLGARGARRRPSKGVRVGLEQ